MSVSASVSEQITPVQEWLAREPADDPVEDLRSLRAFFARLPEPGIAGPIYQHCIDQFEVRARDLVDRFKARLLSAVLPLSRELHSAAGELVAALLDLADGLQRLAATARDRWRPMRRVEPHLLAGRSLALSHEAFLIAAMSATVTPGGLWRGVYGVVRANGGLGAGAEGHAENANINVVHAFKRLLALSVLQPESLTAREIVWANDYLEGVADLAVVAREPLQPAASSFWIDPDVDAAPVATIRSVPPAVPGLMHFSAYGMSRVIVGQVDALKQRIIDAEVAGIERDGAVLEPDVSDLPVGLTPAEALSLMERMRDRWALPPNRTQQRRAHQYSVQVCTGLRAIWEAARDGDGATRIAEWLVFNESPGGYAVMSVAGVTGAVSAGMAVALRRDASHPWSICIVRWIRSDNPEQVELGLQLVSQACTPVTIGFRGGEVRSTTPALILPPIAAVRRNQAILAPAGTYGSRRFVLVHDGEHLYVAQARVLSLDMQTASVELFQYEIDPYPI